MGKDKRKTRLNKTEKGEFVGFSAFAATAATYGSDSAPNPKGQANPSVVLTPIYRGSVSKIAITFQRIGQKRDPTTKTKALQELRAFFDDDRQVRKQQVDALSHFLHIYHGKTNYDNAPSVRCEALACLLAAVARVPKAFKVLSRQQTELFGMYFVAQSDSSTEVRAVATKLWASVVELYGSSENDGSGCNESCLEEGVWSYVDRVVSYGKPKVMHDALFAKKSETSLTELQREEISERFDRIVGTALDAFRSWAYQHDNTKQQHDVQFLYKSVTSLKPIVRSKAYSVIATMYQNNSSKLLLHDKTDKLLLQSLSSEKDPTCIPKLFEMLLSYLSFLDQPVRLQTALSCAKPLNKLLKRSCYGASQWSPSLLPLIASMGDMNLQSSLLSSAFDGADDAISTNSQLEAHYAVIESASFVLSKSRIQSSNNSTDSIAESARDIVNVLLKCLSRALTRKPTSSSRVWHNQVISILTKTLTNFQNLSEDTHFGLLQDWFWDGGLNMAIVPNNNDVSKLDRASLTHFLEELLAQRQLANSSSLGPTATVTTAEEQSDKLRKCLANVFRAVFQNTVKLFDHSVPALEDYVLLLSTLKYCSVSTIFGGEADMKQSMSLEKFVMNHLLRWMIVHSSSISDSKSPDGTKSTFSIFATCYEQSQRQISWNAVLWELMTAKCDIGLLRLGIQEMLKSIADLDQIRCDRLNELCSTIDTVQASTSQIRQFLQLVVSADHPENRLISSGVIKKWVDSCPQVNSSSSAWIYTNEAVLSTLVDLAASGCLTTDESDRIVVQAWRQGGACWDSAMIWLVGGNVHGRREYVVNCMCSELQQFVNNAMCDFHDHDVSLITTWCDMSMRLHDLLDEQGASAAALTRPQEPFLKCVGLSNAGLWDSAASQPSHGFKVPLHCLVQLLDCFDTPEERRDLFEETTEPVALLHDILLSAVPSDTELSISLLQQKHNNMFDRVMRLLDKSLLPMAQRKSILDMSAESVKSLVPVSADDGMRTCQEIALIARLVESMYPKKSIADKPVSPQTSKLSARESPFQAGDRVWYITDSSKPKEREQAEIAKVHRDDALELYYTIRISRDGMQQERQTVLDRLKRTQVDGKDKNDGSTNELQCDKRADQLMEELTALSKLLVEQVLRVNAEGLQPYHMDLISLTTTYCGYGPKRGIGTLHHDVISLVLTAEQEVAATLSQDEVHMNRLVAPLWKLSLSLGYGLNTSPTTDCISMLGFDPSSSVRMIIDMNLLEMNDDLSNDVAIALLAWLTVATPEIGEGSLSIDAYKTLFRLSSSLLRVRDDHDAFTLEHYVSLRAIRTAMAKLITHTTHTKVLADALEEAMAELLSAFSQSWKTVTHESENDSVSSVQHGDSGDSSPIWGPEMCVIVKDSIKHNSPYIRSACRQCLDDLTRTLFTVNKQSLGLRLLHHHCTFPTPLMEVEDVEFSDSVVEQLREWSEGLPTEEIEDMKEDAAVVVQWFPAEIMDQISRWNKEGTDSDDFIACSKMLLWLTLLEIVETSSKSDSGHRQAITSYINKTQVLKPVLEWVLQHATFLNQKGNQASTAAFDLDALLQHPESSTLSELSELVLFRTIEVFPTLTKQWWEMDCPKVYVSPIKDFVVAYLSPEIMKREMERIRAATAFGEMQVSGSLATREVTASYAQDDFNISVSIILPREFPFLSAQVDCSKTYGVPESRWKRWSLIIKMMLNNQGGTLHDALTFWKENVDKEFEGVEPCPVCYSVLHVKTHKLPKLQCTTCSNCFHSDCLMEWFRNSEKNACVLCQQPWVGTRLQ